MNKNVIAASCLILVGLVAAYLITKEEKDTLLTNLDKSQYNVPTGSPLTDLVGSFFSFKTKGIAQVVQATRG